MDALTGELLECERRVWRALAEGDAEADLALLSPDFIGVYPSGVAGRSDHAGQVADGPTVASFELSAARSMVLGEEHALLTYGARLTRPGAEASEEILVSSIWRRAGNGWINIFSQDTPKA